MYSKDELAADRLFRNCQYEEAINLYRGVLTQLSEEKSRHRVQTAIKLCRKKLGYKLGSDSYFQIDKALISGLKELSSIHAEPKDIDIKNPLLTDNSKVDGRELINRLNISPHQTSLILMVAKLVEELDATDSIMRSQHKTDTFDLTIGDILSCVINPLYAKQLQTNLAAKSSPSHICASALSRLQYLYNQFREIENLKEVEIFMRKNIKEKIICIDTKKIFKATRKPSHSVYAGSIFLNEKKFIEKCLVNHYGLISKWCLVEGTCLGYPTGKVSEDGFSKDFSSLILQLFPDPEGKLQYLPHGWTKNQGEDAKSELRNNYLNGATGKVLAIIDIDEFYPSQAFNQAVEKVLEGYDGVTVPQVHFWKSLKRFIIGGYYDISHMRFFKMHKALQYINNHNFPEKPDGTRLDKMKCFKFEREISSKDQNALWSGVYCYHMGFAKDADDMKDKTDYYVNRGEEITRPDTTKSRAAWFTNEIPDNCQVLPFNQEVSGVIGQ